MVNVLEQIGHKIISFEKGRIDRGIVKKITKDCEQAKAFKPRLEGFLNQNIKAIRALRSYNQIIEGNCSISSSDMKLLENTVEKESDGLLSVDHGRMIAIGDNWQKFSHESIQVSSIDALKQRAMKGMFFNFILDGLLIECVDLDGGNSRKYFDMINQEQKQQFINRFAYRELHRYLHPNSVKDWIDWVFDPIGFVAFISPDSCTDCRYKVEDSVCLRRTFSLDL